MQRVGRKVAPEGTAMDDWRIAGELALRLGADFDFATVDEVTDELARVAPALAGVDSALLRRARDGVVLPLREHRDEVVLRTRALSILADDGSGTSWDPIKVEGEAATDSSDVGARRRRPRAETDGEVAAPSRRAAPRVAARALGRGTAACRTSRCLRATRTLCASWWVGGSTTTDAWSAKPPVARARAPAVPAAHQPARRGRARRRVGRAGARHLRPRVAASLTGRDRRRRARRASRSSSSPPTARARPS